MKTLSLVFQTFYRGFISFLLVAGVEDLSNIQALEDEIMELQEYNAQVESEMYQLRTDITRMELPQRHSDRVSITPINHNLYTLLYYLLENLVLSLINFRNNFEIL